MGQGLNVVFVNPTRQDAAFQFSDVSDGVKVSCGTELVQLPAGVSGTVNHSG